MKRTWLLIFVLLLAGRAAQAQSGDNFFYTVNASNATTITLVEYTGPNLGGTLTIPSSINGLTVTGIAANTFPDYLLTGISIPSTVTTIADGAFISCSALVSIQVNSANSNYSTVNNVLFNKSATSLIAYPEGLVGGYAIPIGVTNIESLAFYQCYSLSGVGIPSTVTNIGNEAFAYTGLATVTIPTNVTNIGTAPFQGCASLTSITVTTPNSYYSSSGGALCNNSQTLLIQYPCGLTGPCTLPGTVNNIGPEAFLGCKASAVFMSGITNIGDQAFAVSTQLMDISVSASPLYQTVGGVLFKVSNFNPTTLIQYPGGLGGTYSIPGTVTNIGDWAFAQSSVTGVTIPSNVNTIQQYAFENCSHLTGITIPGSVTNLGNSAFAGCAALAGVTLPGGIGVIGQNEFFNCVDLTNITIPSGITNIGFSAFTACTSLSNVTFPDTLTSIGQAAFETCGKLTSVTIPGGVTNIGLAAFTLCAKLSTVYCEGNAPASDFSFSEDSATVYYLPGTTGWSAFSSNNNSIPIVLWNPNIKTSGPGFGLGGGQFGFYITGTNNFTFVVEACANLANPVWIPLQTNTLASGSAYFSEAFQPNVVGRFYGLAMP